MSRDHEQRPRGSTREVKAFRNRGRLPLRLPRGPRQELSCGLHPLTPLPGPGELVPHEREMLESSPGSHRVVLVLKGQLCAPQL